MRNLVFLLLFTYGIKIQNLIRNDASKSFNYLTLMEGNISNSKKNELPLSLIYSNLASKTEADTPIIDSKINKLLEYEQRSNSMEQLFIHTDRNKYIAGDTIHFQAYIKNQLTNKFESGSRLLYVLLYNDLNQITDSSRFMIKGYTSSGWMKIPFDARKGKYRLVAFTSLMQNFDPSDAFRLDIYVGKKGRNSENIEITYNKENFQLGDTIEARIKLTNEKGKPIDRQKFLCSLIVGNYPIDKKSINTNSNGETHIRFIIPDTIKSLPKLQLSTKEEENTDPFTKKFDIPLKKQSIELNFLPESGTLVSGLVQRIGFNATNGIGESTSVEGLLKSGSGLILDTIKSGEYGPGLFTCKPEPGMYVELIKGFAEKKIWPLPEIKNTGITMSAQPINNASFAVEIQSDNYVGEKLFISGAMNVTQIFSQEIILNKKRRIVFDTGQLPSGVIQITLFNNEHKPIAERLFYVNADKRLKFNIKTDRISYKPGQETELTIKMADGDGNLIEGFFSLAVIDSLSGYNAEIFAPGIEYTLNYNPYFFDNLPSKVLAKGIENLSNEQRDLMFMVFGWKKYNWDFDQEKQRNIKQLTNYDILQMRILNKKNKENMRLNLVELPLNEGSMLSLMTNKNGEIILPLDSLSEGTASVMMLSDTKNKKNLSGAMLSIPCNQQYFESNNMAASGPILTNYNNNVAKSNAEPFISPNDQDVVIEEVTIGGKKNSKEVFVNEQEEMYRNVNIHSISGETLRRCGDFDEALRKAVPTIKFGLDSDNIVGVILNPRISIEKNADGEMKPVTPALFVLNGNPLTYDGYSTVKYTHPNDIESISVLRGYSGYTLYGVDAIGGVIFVNTKNNSDLNKYDSDRELKDPRDQMAKPINLYRPNIEFYNPAKSEIDKDPLLQIGSTIYWKSEIYFDGEDPVKIQYPNLKTDKNANAVLITINGVSFNNLAGSAKASYLIKEGK